MSASEHRRKKKHHKVGQQRTEILNKRLGIIRRYTFAILGLIVLLHAFVFFAFFLRESRDIELQALERSRLFAGELIDAVTGSSEQTGENSSFQKLNSLIDISRSAGNTAQMRFRFAAEEPLNPENAPNSFESEAIRLFHDTNKNEHFEFVYEGEQPHIMYTRPIMSRQECGSCHEEKRFRAGELRGVVSVRIPISDSLHRFSEKKRFYLWSCITLILAVSLVVLSLAQQLSRQIKTSYEIEEESSQTDPLTGLPSRAFILDRLRQEASRALRHDTPLSAVLVSIDHLGAVNNRHGQKAGDTVLVELSSLVIKSLRDYDMVGRYGGEEYLVLLPFTKLEAARDVAERLRSDIEHHSVNYRGRQIKVTVSAGVAQWRGESENIDQLLHRIGMAQYNAQANGRNRVEIDDMV